MCEFCGQRKDAAGNCGCTVTGRSVAFCGACRRAFRTEADRDGRGIYWLRYSEIADGSATIGRDAGNTVALGNDSTVSRHHATITAANGEFSICDNGSSNGTFVNGAKIAGEQKLTPGDEIQIGGTRFRFENV